MFLIKNFIKRFLPHRKEYYYRKFFRRLSPEALTAFLRHLGVQTGDVLFIQSSFSRLGYFPQGPNGLLRLLHEVVGDKGTIAMPSFTFGGSMQSFVAKHPSFDILQSPSKVGLLTEAFRCYPEVRRSIHPTHSICALGDRAEELVEGHERAGSPCGTASPFGKLAGMNAKMLRLGTGSLTLYHHVQELVDYPNLFLPEEARLLCKNSIGDSLFVRTRVYREHIPNILFLGKDTTTQRFTIHPSNFPLLYSGDREEHLRDAPQRQDILAKMLDIRRDFEARGWLTKGAINGCTCELFDIAQYVTYTTKAEQELLERYRDHYTLSELERLFQEGEYPSK